MIRTRKHRTKKFREQIEKNGKNITFDTILAHPEKPWNWYRISRNTFYKAKQNFVERKYNEHLSAYRIQQCWNNEISIPTNPICKRMIDRDYQMAIEWGMMSTVNNIMYPTYLC